ALGSNWSLLLIEAVFVRASGLTTRAFSVSVAVVPLAMVATVHRPLTAAYVPLLAVALSSVSPEGSRSVTRTLLALAGLLLVRVIVNVTVSPTLGVSLLTVLLRDKSACCGSTDAVSLLLEVLGSNWSAWLTAAELACGLGLVSVTVMTSDCGVPGLTVPTVQTPEPSL